MKIDVRNKNVGISSWENEWSNVTVSFFHWVLKKYVIFKHTEVLKSADYIVQRYFWPFKDYFPTLRKVFLY